MEPVYNWRALVDIFYSDIYPTLISRNWRTAKYREHPRFPNDTFMTGILMPERETIEALMKTDNAEKIGPLVKTGMGLDIRQRAQNLDSEKYGLQPADALFLVKRWNGTRNPFRIGPLILPIYKGVPAIERFE